MAIKRNSGMVLAGLMTNILPMVSAPSYRAARDAALRAAPVLEAKGYIPEAIGLRRRAALYDAYAVQMPTRAQRDAFERRIRMMEKRRA